MHPTKTLSWTDYCITTGPLSDPLEIWTGCENTPKIRRKKRLILKNSGLVPPIQPETDFPQNLNSISRKDLKRLTSWFEFPLPFKSFYFKNFPSFPGRQQLVYSSLVSRYA